MTKPTTRMNSWLYGTMTDQAIATAATQLAMVMNEYAAHNELYNMDSFYLKMQHVYDDHVAELRARSWTLNDLADKVLCPEW